MIDLPVARAGRSDSLENEYVKSAVEEITRRFGGLPELRKPKIAESFLQLGRSLDDAADFMPRDRGENRYRKLHKRHKHAICRVAKRRPWVGKAEHDCRSATEWLEDHYGSWIPGLNRFTLRIADPSLVQAIDSQLTNRVGPYKLVEKLYCLPHEASVVEPADHIKRDRKALQVRLLERILFKLDQLQL